MTMNDGEAPGSRRMTLNYGEATVEEHWLPQTWTSEKRYVTYFNDFELARQWIARMIASYEAAARSVHFTAHRKWKEGPEGREFLGTYKTQDNC